jgi:hypothetical protein
METLTNVKPLDNDEALQITGGDWADFGGGFLEGLAVLLGL